MSKIRTGLAILLGLTAMSSAFAATAAKPKITMPAARAIALKSWPGKIAKQELENEGGGLRYSFDLTRGKLKREVGVDAMTGAVVENKDDTGQPAD